MTHKGLIFTIMLTVLFLLPVFSVASFAGVNIEEGLMQGLPFLGTGKDDVDYSVCPQGARTIEQFLVAWQGSDYQGMYDLLDEGTKVDYPFTQARLDFQFMEFKPYKISSIRQNGDNYEFILRFGNYSDNDIDTKKAIINGSSFGLMKASRGSILKDSF